MIFFLTFCARALVRQYSLVPPFLKTDVGEVMHWSIGGNALIQKKIIRLTTGFNNSHGKLCHRAPTIYNSWTFEIDLSFNQDTVIFTFSNACCPNISKYFTGLNLSFTQTSEGNVAVQLKGPEIFVEAKGLFVYDLQSNRVRIRITKNENLTISKVLEQNIEQIVLSVKLPNLYQMGYLSIHAFSPENCDHCATHIYSAYFYNNTCATQEFDGNLSIRNRKSIEKTPNRDQSHSFIKLIRRAQMTKVTEILDEIDKNKYNLVQKQVDFKDAFLETIDIYKRASASITQSNLTNFIYENLIPSIDGALSHLEKINEDTIHIKTDMNLFWEHTKKQIMMMNEEYITSCQSIKSDVLLAAQRIPTHIDDEKLKMQSASSNHISQILFVICACEFSLYFVIFAQMYKKQSRKKRI